MEKTDSSLHTSNDEETKLVIDFEKIEDILDFNKHVSPKTSTVTNSKKRPPMRHKIVAKEPVKLLELKPFIDKFADTNGQSSEEVDHTTKSTRRFRCFVCGDTFIRSSHLYRHIRIHTGDKPYFCQVCRKRFSRSDYKLAHIQSHRNEKLHSCCVCGQIYTDMARFVEHCRLHDDGEYIREAIDRSTRKTSLKRKVQVAEDSILASEFAEQLEADSCVTIEKIDNSTDEKPVVRVENPMYSSHHYQAISTKCNEASTLPIHTISSNGMKVSINVVHLLPQTLQVQ